MIAVFGVLIVGAAAPSGAGGAVAPSESPLPTPSPSTVGYVTPSAVQVEALPVADYSAVIGGLIPYTAASPSGQMTAAYTLSGDTALYGPERTVPVARFAANNFLGEKSTVVAVAFNGPWALVLTPARLSLPSGSGGSAPAQSAGWMRTDLLIPDHALPRRITVSVAAQTLTISGPAVGDAVVFPVGVGTPATPTPTGVTGYLQARYFDPAQDQTTYAINLSSLHSATADEPYGGHDGGLIGIHFFRSNSGAISHGCIRLPNAAIVAVNQLPLGTPISITG